MKLTMSFFMIPVFLNLASCAIESRQLKTLQTLLFDEQQTSSVSNWKATFSGYRASLQPLVGEGNMLFVNTQSDFIEFDGWSIRQVSGFQHFEKSISITDIDDERRFTLGNNIVAVHYCNAWIKREVDAGVSFAQQCVGTETYTNSILVDNLGRIVHIRQRIDGSANTLHLSLSN